MRFTLTIDCDNDAFGRIPAERAREVSRILTAAAKAVPNRSGQRAMFPEGKLMDYNGNIVGRFGFEEDR